MTKIQARNGATVGAGRRVPCAVALLVVVAALFVGAGRSAADPQAAYVMKTGSYLGDGQSSRNITGLGFQPDFVVIKGNVNDQGVARSSTMVGDATKPLGSATGLSNKRIRSLDADGFSVGDDSDVNTSGVTYYWTAFRSSSGQMVVGSYTGNGSSNRTISGLGLQPAYMIIMPDRPQHAGQRFSNEASNASLRFDSSAEVSNRIRSFVSDGFVIGSDNSVNETTRTFHYVAWAEQAGVTHSGYYPGNASDNRDITVVGFQSSFFITKGAWSTSAPVCRSAAMAGDFSLYLDQGTGFSNAIQRFLPDGFQLGSSSSVNNWSESYYYVAFLETRPPTADLAVTMSVDPSDPNVGDTVEYTITVLNNGPDAGTGIALTDALPAGLTYVSNNAGQGSYSNATGIWSVGNLSTGANATLTIQATVNSGTGGQTITNIAAVSAADQADSNPGNNSASAALVVRSADLGITMSVDRPTPNVGDTIQYTLTASNNGPEPATDVTVTDLLPAGLTFVSSNPGQGDYVPDTGVWTIGALNKASSKTLILTASVNAGTGGSTVTNTATIGAAEPVDPVPGNNTASASIVVQSADLGLVKTVDHPTPNTGETIHYTVTLANSGPNNSSGVAVTDLLPAGVSFTSANPSKGEYVSGTGVWTVGDLNASSTATLTITAVVASDVSGTRITNIATVTAAVQEDPVSGNNTASASIDVTGADLAVGMTVDNPSPDEGDRVTYTVTVRNYGPNATTGVALTDLLPAGLTHVSNTPSQGAYNVGSGLWSVGDLSVGTTATLSVVASVNAGTSGSAIVNTARVSASNLGDPVSGNNSASTTINVQGADLGVTLSVDRPTATIGETVHYTVTLTNLGPYAATGVVVRDQIPSGLTYVSHSATQGSYASGTGRWTVGSLGQGSGATLTLAAMVNAGGVGQTITDTASITEADQGDPNSGNNSASVAFTVTGADLALAMVVDNATPTAGDPVRYTLTLSNQGPDVATGVVVTDLLPQGVTYQSSSPSQGGYAMGTGQWTVGSLARLASATLVINASVNAGEAGSTITNLAAITEANPGDPVSANNLASAQIQVQEALPGIRVTSQAQTGETLLPGSAGIEILHLTLENTSDVATSLNELTVSNKTTGTGTAAQLDADWTSLSLGLGGGDGDDTVLGRATFRNGIATFTHLAVGLDPGTSLVLSVSGSASINARTGDLLDVRITGAESFSFSSPVNLNASWPLDPAGSFPVRGISAAQIASTPVPGTTVFTGEADRLALNVVAPCNGYEDDILETIRLQNLGDAQPHGDIGAMKVWTDGGNGIFDEGGADDLLLGSASWSGSAWALTGLSTGVPIGGLRLYVSVDIQPDATPDRTIRLVLPQPPNDGMEMASGASGPVDAAVANPNSLIIREGSDNVITVAAEQPVRRSLLPGGAPQEIIRLQLVNFTARPETLRSLTFENTTVGPGTRAQLDQDWGAIDVMIAGGDNSGRDSASAPLGAASFANGKAVFGSLNVAIEPRQTLSILLQAAPSLEARDGDEFDLRLVGAEDLGFSRAVSVSAEWPLDPVGSYVVDGMAADQITMHPTPSSSFTAGSTRNLVLDVTLPPNGYEEDLLTRLDLVNLGTATPGSDISKVEIWVDDGDGAFESNQDRALGSMVNTGARWEITALSERVPMSGLRVFASVDVSGFAREGRSIRFCLPSEPDVAVGMATGDDGPIDRAVEDPTSHVISGTNRLTVVAETIEPGVVHPGDRGVLLLHMVMTNTYDAPQTLTGVTFTNSGIGTGSRSDLDSDCDVVTLHLDNGEDGVFNNEGDDPGLASVAFSDGKAVMRGFAIEVAAHASRHLYLTADVSTRDATDGDALAATIAEPLALDFAEPIGAVAEWPIDSGARWIVDGMVTRQIVNFGSGVATLGPGQGPVVAMDFSLPSNGYVEDFLNSIRLYNTGTAGPTQIAEVALWRDGGDGIYSPVDGSDVFLGTLTWGGDGWTSGSLQERLPLNGARFFVSVRAADVISQHATIQLAIPLNGLTVQSTNDGPIDMPLENPEVILLSSAPLLTTLTTDPAASTAGGLFEARMLVQNVGDETIVGTAPILVETPGPISVEIIEGPSPSALTLAPGETGRFEWSCTARTAGEARLRGYAEGTGETSELPRRSMESSSGTHYIYTQAEELELFAASTPPFSVNRGQTGIVPLSLTCRNPGGEQGSSVKLTGLRIRLEDELGRGIVPAEMLTRIAVREGNRIFLEKGPSSLETSGAEIDLTLATPVVITTFEPATLNLELDVSPNATAATFRATILDGSWFRAEDVTNRAPVTLDLKERTYPIRSGLARLVAEATQVEVSRQDADTTRVGPGQPDVTLLALTLENIGIGGISSEVRVGGFAIEVVDPDGTPLQDPGSLIRAIRVRTLLQTLIDRPIGAGAGDSLALQFVNPLTLPVNTPITLTIAGDIAEGVLQGAFRIRLRGESSFDIRDANTNKPVPPRYLSDPFDGSAVVIERPATTLVVRSAPGFPTVVTVGERDVTAMTGAFRHPGTPGTSRIRPSALTVECRNEERTILDPSLYLLNIGLFVDDREITSVTDMNSSRRSVELPIDGIILDPEEIATFRLVVSVRAAAPAAHFEIAISGSNVQAVDANSGAPLSIEPDAGAEFPLVSGVTRLRPPARELVIALESKMPAAIAADGRECAAAALTLSNPAPPGSGSIRVDHLRVRAADGVGTAVSLGAAAGRVEAYEGGSLRAESAELSPDSTTSMLVFGNPLVLEPGGSATIEVRIRPREDASFPQLRLGWEKADIGIVQPEGVLLAIEARAAGGQAFPLWTDYGSFSSRSLEESYGNFPNPFGAGREETSFVYYLPSDALVTLRIWSSRGEAVVTLLEGESQSAGLHQSSRWDGRNGRGSVVVNGVYVAELVVQTDGGEKQRLLRKVAVVR